MQQCHLILKSIRKIASRGPLYLCEIDEDRTQTDLINSMCQEYIYGCKAGVELGDMPKKPILILIFLILIVYDF